MGINSRGINYFSYIDSFKYEIDDSNGLDVLVFNDDALRINEENEVDIDDDLDYIESDEQIIEKLEIVEQKLYPSILRYFKR